MPIVVSETDTFAQTVSRPANGELADAASIAQFEGINASRERWLYNRARGLVFDVTRAPYNADPLGVVDATSAVNAAISAAASAGGDVFAPGIFLCNGTINCDPLVNVRGLPFFSRLRSNSSSADLLSFATGSNSGNACEISDICFDAAVTNTGRAVFNHASHPVDVIFRNCFWNDPSGSGNLTGDIFNLAGASQFRLVDCKVSVLGSSAHAAVQSNAAGRFIMRGGSLIMPATFSGSLIQDDGWCDVEGVRFLLTSHLTGSPSCIKLSLGGRVVNNLFEDFGAGVAKIATESISGTARVNAAGNTYLSTTPCAGVFQLGSHLDLFPYWNETTPSLAFTLTRGAQALAVQMTGATGNRTITMPDIFYPGQEFDLLLFNNTGSGFFNTTLTGIDPLVGEVLMNAGQATSWRFRAMDPTGFTSYRWVPISGPTTFFAP